MTEWIGFENTGCNIEFSYYEETPKAYRVKTLEGILVWLPKYIFDDFGCIKQRYNQMFYDNLKQAVSNYRGKL